MPVQALGPLQYGQRPADVLDSLVSPGEPSFGLGRRAEEGAPERRRLRMSASGFKDDAQRAAAYTKMAVAELLRVLPSYALAYSVGGLKSYAQLGRSTELEEMAHDILARRPGTDASNIKGVISTVHLMWDFASGQNPPLPAAGFYPEASMGLVAAIVRREHRRATCSGEGSQGGWSVGDKTRGHFYFMHESMHLPVDTGEPKQRHPIIVAAAPQPGARAPQHSASLPVVVYVHMETLAASRVRSPLRFLARSFVLLGLLMGVRLRDLLRSSVLPPELRQAVAADAGTSADESGDADEADEPEEEAVPLGVIRGRVSLSKDGRPMDLYALAEGVTGPLTWVAEHFEDVSRQGQFLPGFSGPSGYGGHIDNATGLGSDVISSGKLRDAWSRMLTLPPLSLSPATLKAFAIRGHSIHGSLADLARYIGEAPHPSLGLALPGFTYNDIRELGHWQRDPNEPVDAAEAARAAAAAGRAAPAPGAPTLAGSQPLRYSSGEGRQGERSRQILVRQKAVNWMRTALTRYQLHGGWQALLPHVRQHGTDWDLLFPERHSLVAMPPMQPPPRCA
jgi:hypothetical protein